MYSNSILKESLPEIQKQGVLGTARWAKNKAVTPTNQAEAGEELFKLLCISCHSVGGFRNDILERTSGMKVAEFESVFDEMGAEEAQMPPFAGTSKKGKPSPSMS